MKIFELISEQGTIGSTTGVVTPVSQSPTPTTGQQPGAKMSGNVTALTDPKMQAAMLAQQKKQQEEQKKQVADQIRAMQQQLQALQKQQQDLNRTV